MNSDLWEHESIQSQLIKLRLYEYRNHIISDFTLKEVEKALRELRIGKSADSTGLVTKETHLKGWGEYNPLNTDTIKRSQVQTIRRNSGLNWTVKGEFSLFQYLLLGSCLGIR